MTDTFDPLSVAGSPGSPGIGHNAPPATPFDLISTEINDLFDEAKNWADGEQISSQEIHDAIEDLRTKIHEAGKRADAIRIDEKRPLDEQVKAIQDKFNPLIQPKRGKVDMAKSALDALLTPWRTRIAQEKAADAARVAAAAEEARAAAIAAMQASSGNLAAREEAEELLADAKKLERTAKRTEKAATTGTGLRTVWTATMTDAEAGLDWAYGRDPARFTALVQQMADEAVRSGVRAVPGFVVAEEKRAA